jgi:leucine dehydrogenase
MHVSERSATGYERVLALEDAASGLRGFLAIHSTALGPALGGIRISSYKSDDDALNDALRLSRAMTYKTALAELPAGGGKSVVIVRPSLNRPAAFEALGEVIESLGGTYFTGPDVGVTPADLAAVRRTTRHVADETSPELGNIAEHTAIGVWHGMRACLDFRGLKRARVAIQGVGSVGACLARILHHEGFELTIADVNQAHASALARELGATLAQPEEILSAECDVLAPCALGGVLNPVTIPHIRARIVCGCANNVLSQPEDSEELCRREIIYAPDYLVNAGGVIRGGEFYLLGLRDSQPSLARIYDRMMRVLEMARERRCPTSRVADDLAEARWKRIASTAI